MLNAAGEEGLLIMRWSDYGLVVDCGTLVRNRIRDLYSCLWLYIAIRLPLGRFWLIV